MEDSPKILIFVSKIFILDISKESISGQNCVMTTLFLLGVEVECTPPREDGHKRGYCALVRLHDYFINTPCCEDAGPPRAETH